MELGDFSKKVIEDDESCISADLFQISYKNKKDREFDYRSVLTAKLLEVVIPAVIGICDGLPDEKLLKEKGVQSVDLWKDDFEHARIANALDVSKWIADIVNVWIKCECDMIGDKTGDNDIDDKIKDFGRFVKEKMKDIDMCEY